MDLTAELARALGLPQGLDAIARTLVRTALWGRNGCTWTMVERFGSPEHVEIAARLMGVSVYDGLAGVALFLSHYAQYRRDSMARRTCAGALQQMQGLLLQGPLDTGLYTGALGAACVGLECSLRLGLDPEQWLTLSRQLPDSPLPQNCDLLDGLSGVVLGMLNLYELTDEPRYLQSAIAAADVLIASGRSAGFKLSWPQSICQSSQDMTGLAHGASAPILALAELYARTGSQRFIDAARAGVEYEDGWFNEDEANWPDFRTQTGAGAQLHFSNAWCHGAAGICLVRARLYEVGGDSRELEKLQAAIKTLRRGINAETILPRMTQGLCHGAAGNAAILMYIGQTCSDPAQLCDALRAANDLLAVRFSGEVESERRPYAECPSLMTGLSGNGWLFLSLLGAVNPGLPLLGLRDTRKVPAAQGQFLAAPRSPVEPGQLAVAQPLQ
jgi:lantibiotic biosynthesis protein